MLRTFTSQTARFFPSLVCREPVVNVCTFPQARCVSTSLPARDLREFLDIGSEDANVSPGREWFPDQLRRKSFDDLHRLWYVLLKERIMLKSEQLKFRQMGKQMPQPTRITKVRKSMNRIKQVLSQRALEHPDPNQTKSMLKIVNAM